MLYKLSEIARIVDGQLIGDDLTVCSVATDSRTVVSTDALFVAITGVNHDGHLHIQELNERGVHAFLVQHLVDNTNGSFVVVDDPLRALQKLAAHHRQQYKGEVVAITGSNGKTIVKEWIAQLWNPENGKLLRSPRSYNSQLGVALSLMLIEGDEKLVVVEAGISQPGEMETLTQMIRPTVGIFTNLGTAHDENFTSQKQKLAEKQKLFASARHVLHNNTQGTIDQQNLSSVLGLYDFLKLSHKSPDILQPVAMRLEVQQGFLGSTIINDSYNCDTTSLSHALDFMASQATSTNRRVVILSDIFAQTDYTPVARLIEQHNVDMLIGIGDNLLSNKHLFKGGKKFFSSTEHFLQSLDMQDFANSVVLVKGSRSSGFERISACLESRTHATTLEINLAAMTSNLNYYRHLIPAGCRLMAMVKASGYGAGGVEVGRMLERQGVNYLAVAYADEGVALRQGGITLPVVVLNAAQGSFAQMIEHDLEPEIYSFTSLHSYIQEATKHGLRGLPIHVKIDSGMHRLGFMEPQVDELIAILKSTDVVRVGSIFSHLAASEDPAEDAFTLAQIDLFQRLSGRIDPTAIHHICNSAAIERFPQAHLDMVRLGIGLYGVGSPKLEVVSTLKTRIVQIKTLETGQTVGYNRRGTIAQQTRIGIIPIGYADGLNRHLGRGAASFLVGNALCPTIGNICMDTAILDLTNAPQTAEGDQVVIFGNNPRVEDLAQVQNTIPYEIFTTISQRIKRIYVNE